MVYAFFTLFCKLFLFNICFAYMLDISLKFQINLKLKSIFNVLILILNL